jgi:hypothetical protein
MNCLRASDRHRDVRNVAVLAVTEKEKISGSRVFE